MASSSVPTVTLSGEALTGVDSHLISAGLAELPRTVKLGRRRPKARPQALQLAAYLPVGYTVPPLPFGYSSTARDAISRMYLNDTLGCHSADTEVLTEHGWKLWPEYDGTSLLGTMSQESGMLEFQAPLACQRFDHNGPMAFAAHKGLDFALTSDHRMLYREYRIPWPYVPGGAGYGRLQFGMVRDLPTRCQLPGSTSGFIGTELKTLVIGERVWDGIDFLRLLSLVLSDGFVAGGETQRNRVSFCCFREDRRDMVASFAHRLGIREEASRKGVWLLYDAGLAEWLRSNAYTGNEYRAPYKRVPDLVKVASQNQIEEFLRFFGDQSLQNGESRQFYSSSRRLTDDLQELLLRIGKRGTVYDHGIREGRFASDGRWFQQRHPSYTIHEHQESSVVLQRLKRCPTIEYDHYKGEVFCATVPNSTLVTRRNGRILISGNCCVIADRYHSVGVWTGSESGTAVQGTDAEVKQMYHGICGPGDNGCVIGDVLNYTRDHGLPFNGVIHKIDGYVSVDWTNWDEVLVALYLFGALTLGINLPGAWTSAAVWDVTNTRIVGGHDVPALDAAQDGITISSWGRLYKITRAAFTSRKWVEECYAVLSPDWYAKAAQAPNLIDAATLLTDLTKLGGGTIPPIGPTPNPPVPPGPTPPVPPVPPTPGPTKFATLNFPRAVHKGQLLRCPIEIPAGRYDVYVATQAGDVQIEAVEEPEHLETA